MEKLESDINELMNKQNQNWVNAIKEAQKNKEGIDLSEMFGKYSEIIANKEKAFQDAKIRMKEGGKKKSFFGEIYTISKLTVHSQLMQNYFSYAKNYICK